MTIESRFKHVTLKALGMILWWVAWRMDKLNSNQFKTTLKEIDDLAKELQGIKPSENLNR